MKRISVAAPLLTGNEKKYVMDAVESTWISIAVRLRGNKKVQNLSSMWYKKLPQQLATQGDFGLEPSYYTLLSTAIPDTGTCF